MSNIHDIAHRLNSVAQSAELQDNKIFEIARFHYLISLNVVTALTEMKDTYLRTKDEPLLFTSGRAATMV